MAETGIEGLLRAAAGATVYPVAPDVRAAVELRIGARGDALTLTPSTRSRQARSQRERGQSTGQRISSSRLRVAFGALVAVAVGLTAVLAVEPSRDAVARFFGVQGSRIEVLPTAGPGVVISPVPARALSESGVAREVPLSEIAAAVGFEPRLPAGYGPPRQAYVVQYGDDAVVVLQYDDFDLWEARLRQDATFGKSIEPDSIFLEVMVGREPGYWLAGAPHFVSYYDRNGRFIPESARTVEKNTLVWRTDAAFYRIETKLELKEAATIAVTLP